MSISYFFLSYKLCKKMSFTKMIYFTWKRSMCNILVQVHNKQNRQHQTRLYVLKYSNDCDRNISLKKYSVCTLNTEGKLYITCSFYVTVQIKAIYIHLCIAVQFPFSLQKSKFNHFEINIWLSRYTYLAISGRCGHPV